MVFLTKEPKKVLLDTEIGLEIDIDENINKQLIDILKVLRSKKSILNF